MKKFNTNPIVNIVRAELITEETEPRVLHFETVSSASPEPFISEGEESELRIRNTIVAQERLEDIIKGYNITLKDCVLSRELLEVVDGGNAAETAGSGFAGYSSPVAGKESARVRFSLHLYAAEKDYAGDAVSFFRFSFPHCVGSPAKFSLENGTFATPEYTVRSRPGAGECAMRVEVLDRLPVYCASEEELPTEPEAGDCIIALAPLTIGTAEAAAGDMVYYDGADYIQIK